MATSEFLKSNVGTGQLIPRSQYPQFRLTPYRTAKGLLARQILALTLNTNHQIARMVARDPLPISVALSELIAIRGFARVRSSNELEAAWKQVAGLETSAKSFPLLISRGTLTISVENAPLLSELASFQGPDLLQQLKQQYPHLKIKTLKFKLSGT